MLIKHSQLKNRLSFYVWFLLFYVGFLVCLLAWIYACLKLCCLLSYILMVDRPQVKKCQHIWLLFFWNALSNTLLLQFF